MLFRLPRRGPPLVGLVRLVVGAAPFLLAVAGVDEGSVLLDGFVGGLDHAEAAFAADRFACGELRALLRDPRRLLVLPGLLALARARPPAAARCCLTEGGATRSASLPSTFEPVSSLRLVDALPVGVRESGGVDEPLRDEQAQDDRERGLGRPRAHERGERRLVGLLLGLRAARVADGHLALLVRRRRLLDAEPVRPRRRLAVVQRARASRAA